MPQGQKLKQPSLDTRRLPNRPIWENDDLSVMLRSYDRQPFFTVLAYFLECGPEPEDIYAMAQKKPDLWVKAITDLARIAGFSEKQEVLHTVNVNQMSDSQLEDAARDMAAKLGLEFSPRLLTHKPSPIPSDNNFLKEADDAEIISSKPLNMRRRRKK